MNYCGVSKQPIQRIWQHITHARHAAYGSTKAIHHYQAVAHLDCEFFYAFIPLAYVPNRSREHHESFIIKTFKYRLNYANLNTHGSIKDKDTPSRMGFFSRFRRRNPHQKLLPNLSTSKTLDLFNYTCPQTKDFNPKLNDLLRTSSTSKDITIHITPGSADATDWYQVQEFFGCSTITTPFGLCTTLSEIRLAIRTECITSFTITKLICPLIYQDTRLTYTKLFGSISNDCDTTKIAKLYSYLDAAELIYNTFERKRAMSLLFKAFNQFKISRPPMSLCIRTTYPQMILRTPLVRAGRYLIAASALPKSAQNLIFSRTTLVNKNPNTIGDICCNNLKWASKFDVNHPWPCCDQCSTMHQLPHRNTYNTNCLAFKAEEYSGPFTDVIQCSLKTVPFPDRQSIFHGLVTGLLSFQQRLQIFTKVDVSKPKIKELASRCIKRNFPPGDFIKTSRVKAMAEVFNGCVMYGLDKNTKMMFVCCPLFHWHLMYNTFKFAATGQPSAGLNYTHTDTTPARYIHKKKSSYKWSHISRFSGCRMKDSESRLARADVIQKYAKDKGRPMVRCHREPERLLKSRICKAGFFMLTHAGLDHLGISNTRLLNYKDRWEHREKLGAKVQTMELLDDMSGFYTSLNRNGVLQRASYVLKKFKACHRKSRHWISVPKRGNGTPRFGKSTNDDDYVWIHVDEILDVLTWASQFSCFMFGTSFLEQTLGLFQGCALSVILALFTASADEDKWLGSLGADRSLVFGFRYFDDRKLWFIYNMFSATSRARATALKEQSTMIYMAGIECEPEESPNFLETCISELSDGSLHLAHNNKNWDSVCQHNSQSVYTQLPRCSFSPTSVIDGHRASRLKTVVMHSNNHFGMITAALQQIIEWTTCLGDTTHDAIRILRCLQHNTTRITRGVWPTVLQITTKCSGVTDLLQPIDGTDNVSECSNTVCD